MHWNLVLFKVDGEGSSTHVGQCRQNIRARMIPFVVPTGTMMRFAHELRSPKDLDLPKAGEGWTKKEMDLAHRLIEALADKWKPEEFRDTYTEAPPQGDRGEGRGQGA